jgi:hypothetical protein
MTDERTSIPILRRVPTSGVQRGRRPVLDQRHYVQYDANFNVTALLDASGDVLE